jgi:hypothetical protein
MTSISQRYGSAVVILSKSAKLFNSHEAQNARNWRALEKAGAGIERGNCPMIMIVYRLSIAANAYHKTGGPGGVEEWPETMSLLPFQRSPYYGEGQLEE